MFIECRMVAEEFWQKFLGNKFPKAVYTKINIEVLEQKNWVMQFRLLHSEYARAKKCVQYLRYGAPSFQSKKLPGCVVKNSATALKFGAEVIDVIASWVDKQCVCGPFKSPPVEHPQHGKVRLCLNVSLPKGNTSCPRTGAVWGPPLWSPHVVCVHAYIYVVCELRHGEFTTSAAQLYTTVSGLMHILCVVTHSE